MTFLRIVTPLYLFCWSMIFSENRFPLFGIMLCPTRTIGGDHAARRLRPTAVLSKPRASGGGGYASETQVRRGDRVVHGDKELIEKLGRNDLCPCGSGRRFQEMLP